jgi:hypothetical protein
MSSSSLILPMAIPLWHSEPETLIVKRPPTLAAVTVPHRQRPRAERVGMYGAGYRVVVEEQQVSLVNLSVSGAQVRGSIKASRNQPLIFRIGWPQDRTSCDAIARVRWVCLDPDGSPREGIYRIGLAFETWDVRRLKEIIRHCERTFGTKVEAIGPW